MFNCIRKIFYGSDIEHLEEVIDKIEDWQKMHYVDPDDVEEIQDQLFRLSSLKLQATPYAVSHYTRSLILFIRRNSHSDSSEYVFNLEDYDYKSNDKVLSTERSFELEAYFTPEIRYKIVMLNRGKMKVNTFRFRVHKDDESKKLARQVVVFRDDSLDKLYRDLALTKKQQELEEWRETEAQVYDTKQKALEIEAKIAQAKREIIQSGEPEEIFIEKPGQIYISPGILFDHLRKTENAVVAEVIKE